MDDPIPRRRTLSPPDVVSTSLYSSLKNAYGKPNSLHNGVQKYHSTTGKLTLPSNRYENGSYIRDHSSYINKLYQHRYPPITRKTSEGSYFSGDHRGDRTDSTFQRVALDTVHHIPQSLRKYSCEELSQTKQDSVIRTGELVKDRYQIMQEIGRGSFGQVFKALDKQTGKLCAVKVIKDVSNFKKLADEEISILEYLAKQDQRDENNFLHLTDHFTLRDQTVIMVFDLLSVNLYQLIHRNNFRGFAPSLVRKFVRCILNCLKLLHR